MQEYLNKFINYLEFERNYSKLTIKSYKRDIDYFLLYLNDIKVSKLEKVDYEIIRRYLVHLYNHKYSKKTISRYISSLRTFYNFLYNEEIIKNNPTILVSNPKLDKKLPNYLYTSDLEKILGSANEDNFLSIRDSFILELLYSTGIRVSEIVNIKIEDINLKEKTIKIHGKGNKERYVIYGNECEKKLNKYLRIKNNNNNFLITNNRGEKITTRAIENIVKKYQKKSGIGTNVSPHTLRHTFATHMLNGGADLKTVQELMGHESLSSTQVYTHITSERLRSVYLHTHPRAK